MHATRRPLFPTEEEFDRIAARYFVVPSLLWGVALLAIAASASLAQGAESTAEATHGEPATVAYGA
jgi:hypothetical protein